MGLLEAAAILFAGIAAGTINAVVGSGTLITFPTLLALGVPPLTANISNSIGLVPGSVAGAVGYRRELKGQRTRVLRLAAFATVGGIVGAVHLLLLPAGAFEAIVPVLILLGVLLVLFQPRLATWVARRHGPDSEEATRDGAWWVPPAAFATGVYGGYFGAAQGVILVAVLGIGLSDSLQRLNALKNVLVAAVNGIAGVLFVIVSEFDLFGTDAEVDWQLVGLIGVGAVIGGFIGAAVGRRLPAIVLRALIATVGTVALVVLLAT